MPKNTWESIRDNKQELEKLIRTIGRIDAIISDRSDPRLGNVVLQLTQLLFHPEQPDAKRIFEEGIQVLGDRLSYIKETEEMREEYKAIQEIEGYQDVENQLTLPEPDTAAFVAESIRSVAYDTFRGKLVGGGSSGVEVLFFNFAALYDKVKDAEDWRNVKISMDELHGEEQDGPATQLGVEFGNRSAMLFLDDLPNDQRLKMLRFAKNGEEISRFLYKDYIRGAWEKLRECQNAARPGGRCFPLKYVNNNSKLSAEQVQEKKILWESDEKKRADEYTAGAVANIISCRAVAKLKPEEGKHFWDAGKVGKSANEIMLKYTPDFVASMSREDLCEVILKDEEGKALTDAFRKYVAALDEIPRALPEEARPTAKDRIEVLQAKLRNRNATPAQKREWTAEIIATREAVNAQRGGAGLDTVLTDKMCSYILLSTDRVAKNLKTIFKKDEEICHNIVADAASGRGDKMMENYRKHYTAAISGDSLRDGDFAFGDVDQKLLPTAKQRIESLQALLRKAPRNVRNPRVVKTLAAILAARENVNARRGGAGLEKRLTDSGKLDEATREYEDMLLQLDEADLKLLAKKALSGHGGDMKETFNSQQFQEKIIPKLLNLYDERTPGLIKRGGSDAVSGLAGILYIDMVRKNEDMEKQKAMLRLGQIDKGIKYFRELPDFQIFLNKIRGDQAALSAAANGDFNRVKEVWNNAALEHKNQQKGGPQVNVGNQQKGRQEQNVDKQSDPLAKT